MAPDRGSIPPYSDDSTDDDNDHDLGHATSRSIAQEPIGQEPDASFLAKRSEQPQFTLRALLVGLLIGVLIAFSNTYFGLQTGWISGMAMPSALIGYAYFKGLRALMGELGGGVASWGWGEGFSEVENVLVQTVAGSVGTMPLGCGFVGVVPALEYLLRPEETPGSDSQDADIVSALAAAQETGGLRLPLGKLILWALGLCFFGVVFAVPLRKEVIVREKLRFPSGTATALMIGVLHGGEKTGTEGGIEATEARRGKSQRSGGDDEESQALMGDASAAARESVDRPDDNDENGREDDAQKKNWKKQIRLLTYSFMGSGLYVRDFSTFVVPPTADRTLILCNVDFHILLSPSTSLYPIPRHLPCECLALEPESFPGLRWPRYHHGSSNHHSHASRCTSWVGCPLPYCKIPRLGSRRSGRLE